MYVLTQSAYSVYIYIGLFISLSTNIYSNLLWTAQ